MRTRKATPKTPASQKKTPPAKKSAAKTPSSTPETPAATPSSTTQPSNTPESLSTPSSDPKPVPETPVDQAKESAEEVVVSPPSKTTTRKVTKRIVKKKVLRPKTPASAKNESAPAVKTSEAEEVKTKEEDTTDAKDGDSLKIDDVAMKDAEVGTENGDGVGDSQDKGKEKMVVDESSAVETEPTEKMESLAVEVAPESVSNDNPSEAKEVEDEDPEEDPDGNEESLKTEKETHDKQEDIEDDQKKENLDEAPDNKNDDNKQEAEGEVAQSKGDDGPSIEGVEDYGEEEGFVEPGDEDLQEDEEPDMGDEMKALDEENKELAAAAKERKVKKELEIFVGGLAREVVEDDVRKTFEKVGEVVEVRLLKDPATNKNRGFAFVRFATKDQAKRALSEMKNPTICGKRCGTAPNEDNDTLFLGNICNTWTKEAIKQKLKEYNIEGVESITLVQDPRHEGLSRGFCFIQFACHGDAMNAYKRLQKTDAVFGHTERTAKVAFAEPLQEPDPEVMAKVKSVFVDGLPPHWDEDRVRKHFKDYGEIERITLARNMSSAKRKDFGFVDFMTHEAAIACIEDVNSKELVDGKSKTKVRARLSNPLPKTQAVKGGMCGGFRIGSRPVGKSFGRSGPVLNRPNFQYGRSSRGQFNEPFGPYGRRAPYRAGYGPSGLGPVGRPNFGGPRDVDRSFARPVAPRREPFPVDDGYSRPYMGRQYEDPYAYSDGHGLKRPYYMTEQDPSYMEPSRVRPRFDYTSAGRGTYNRGSSAYSSGTYNDYGAGSSAYSSGYYGPPDYTSRPHSSYNSRDRSYGGGSHGYYY